MMTMMMTVMKLTATGSLHQITGTYSYH